MTSTMPKSEFPYSFFMRPLHKTRKYRPGDFESLVALRARLFKDDFMDLGLWSDEWNREHLTGMLTRCRHCTIMVGNNLIGFAQWSEYPDQLHIQYLALAPEYQRLGIGSQLLWELQDKAQQISVPVTLSLFHKHSEAVSFYQSAGFVVVDTTERFVRMRWTQHQVCIDSYQPKTQYEVTVTKRVVV
jgi:ribosomal protein S18 acetylase RimI-like enzyme